MEEIRELQEHVNEKSMNEIDETDQMVQDRSSDEDETDELKHEVDNVWTDSVPWRIRER